MEGKLDVVKNMKAKYAGEAANSGDLQAVFTLISENINVVITI